MTRNLGSILARTAHELLWLFDGGTDQGTVTALLVVLVVGLGLVAVFVLAGAVLPAMLRAGA